MFLKYYQGLDVPGATPGDRTETCMSEDRSQTAGTEPGGGGGGRVHPDLGDSTLSTLEAVSWRMGPEEAGRSAPRGRS